MTTKDPTSGQDNPKNAESTPEPEAVFTVQITAKIPRSRT